MVKDKKDFRVVFVNLKDPLPVMSVNSRFTYEQIGIGYLASVLRSYGYPVKIVDAQTMNLSEGETVNEILDFAPELVGFSPLSITFDSACNIAEVIKKQNDEIHICLGGPLITFVAEEIMKDKMCFDSMVRGYGEETILELADRLRVSKSLEGVQGVFYRDAKGNIKKNRDRSKMSNLDTIPFPARDSLEQQIREGYSPTARVITSRGCIFNCSFCSTPSFEGIQGEPLWCTRSSKNVLEELKYLVKEFGVTTILFSDDNFIGPGRYGRRRAKEIVNGIIEEGLNINYRILCRADALLSNSDLLPLFKKSGLERVILGVESGCTSGLQIFNKGSTVEQNTKAIQLLKKTGIALELGFIMLHPYVTFKELKENVLFLMEIDEAASPYPFLSRLALYPGAPLINKLEEDDLLYQFDYKSPFGYKFQNPRIEVLAEALGKIGSWFHFENIEESVYKWGKELLNAEFFLSSNWLKSDQSVTKHANERLFTFQTHYKDLREEVSTLNSQFFMKCIELAECGWEIKTFEILKGQYLQHLRKAYERLYAMNKSILGKVYFDTI